jgi:hypothetical protein
VYISRGNESLASAGTELRPIDEDVMMQFDVFGTSLNMWAWRPEEQMPSAPLIIATDNRLARGEAGVHYYSFQPSSMLGSAIFRFVHVADMHIPIPEPSTLGISVFSLLGLMRYRDRRP